MGILSILGKGIKAMYDEATTPESFKIGQNFEDYVRKYIFTDRDYDLLEKTHDYKTNSKDYVKSSLKPDFKFRDRETRMDFYVEANFRSGMVDGRIIWCNDNQMRRYKEYNRETPVFLILGVGKDPKYPELLSLMPLEAAKYTGLFPSYVKEFKIKVDKRVSSDTLWDR